MFVNPPSPYYFPGFGLFISKSIVDLHEGTISAYSEGEGKGCTFLFKIPMRRKKIMSAASSLVAVASPRGSAAPRVDLDSRRSSAPGLLPGSGSPVRKKDARRLAEQRERLARSLSGMSPRSSLHGDDDNDLHLSLSKKQQQKGHQRSIHLEHINKAFRSNLSPYRSVREPDRESHNAPLSNNESSANDVDTGGGQYVGDGSGPAVPTYRDMGRGGGGSDSGGSDSGGSDSGGGDSGEKGDAAASDVYPEEKVYTRSTSWLPQPSQIPSCVATPAQPSQIPSSAAVAAAQPGKVPSNKSIASLPGLCEEMRSPTNTLGAPEVVLPSNQPRRGSRQINLSSAYTGD